MKRSNLNFLSVVLVLGLMQTGCARVYFHNGDEEDQRDSDIETSTWKHNLVELVELGSPVNIKSSCGNPNAWQEIYTRKSFLNGLVSGATFGIYTPWQADVTCKPESDQKQPDEESES